MLNKHITHVNTERSNNNTLQQYNNEKKSVNKLQGNSGTTLLGIFSGEESKAADTKKNADNSRCSG